MSGVTDPEPLAVDGLRAGYGGTIVLWDVSLTLARGEVVALVGRNGAGKSTLMRALIGLLETRAGSIRHNGAELARLPPEQRARRGLGYVPQGREVFAGLTVEENLRMGDQVAGDRAERKVLLDTVLQMFPILVERGRQKAGTLSGGQQQMLAIARALVGGPDVLLLDEPSEGLQPSIIKQIEGYVVELRQRLGLSILIVEQNCAMIRQVADRCYVLDRGRLIQHLDGEELRHTRRLEECLAL